MKVANRKAVRQLAISNMKSSKSRNIMAVSAIALTTLLFTALSVIVMAVIAGFEQEDFRTNGGYYHASYDYMTKEQYDELKTDKNITHYGTRRILGTSKEAPLNKANVEVSYVDENAAKYMYIQPDRGHLPKEVNEAATDTKILSLLGVEPVIGSHFTVTIKIGNMNVEREFVLCGYWENDPLSSAEHILVSESLVEELVNFSEEKSLETGSLEKKSSGTDVIGTDTSNEDTSSEDISNEDISNEDALKTDDLETVGKTGVAGSYSMMVLFDSDFNIKKRAERILKEHGYQNEVSSDENYVRLYVNSAYRVASVDNYDAEGFVIIGAIVLIIGMTGFLIIYSIFHISVINDIRRYGLLKTIGTTKKQLKRMVYIEAAGLSAIGIPIGLLLGIVVGKLMIPLVISAFLTGADSTMIHIKVSLFGIIVAAVFSFVTVMISCKKPAKMAGSISPIEATKYLGENGIANKSRQNKAGKNKPRQNGISITGMAFANLRKNRKRTAIVILSLMMPLLLLNLTVVITNGFDMDRYLKIMPVDYIIASAGQINNNHVFDADDALSKETVDEIREGISDYVQGGITYSTLSSYEYITEEWFRTRMSGNEKEAIDYWVENSERKGDLIEMGATIFGMEEFCLNQLTVFDGDIQKIYEEGNYIAAIYAADEHDQPDVRTNWAKVGDTVNVRYVYEEEYYNPDTGEVYTEEEVENLSEETPVWERALKYEDKAYEVAVVVLIPPKIRLNGWLDSFVLPAEKYLQDSNSDAILYYACDLKESADNKSGKNFVNAWVDDFTTNVHSECDYTGKEIFKKYLNSFCHMFLIFGIMLNFIVGVIGILNLINIIHTSVVVRNREFAVMHSIGMTKKQLRRMLMTEGLIYSGTAFLVAVVIITVTSKLMKKAIEEMFWFVKYEFYLLPVIVIGIVMVVIGMMIPLLLYRRNAYERHLSYV